jgi:hypothetical protein
MKGATDIDGLIRCSSLSLKHKEHLINEIGKVFSLEYTNSKGVL